MACVLGLYFASIAACSFLISAVSATAFCALMMATCVGGSDCARAPTLAAPINALASRKLRNLQNMRKESSRLKNGQTIRAIVPKSVPDVDIANSLARGRRRPAGVSADDPPLPVDAKYAVAPAYCAARIAREPNRKGINIPDGRKPEEGSSQSAPQHQR